MKTKPKRLPYELIAFDADDTLWVNEPLYHRSQDTLEEILTDYLESRELRRVLYRREIENLKIFGYGVKGFTLSMIETAVELTEGKVRGEDIQRIIDVGKALLRSPVTLLEGVVETLQALQGHARLIIITKGDLFDQESKIARSGLADYFEECEIVSDKSPETYARLMRKHKVDPDKFLMVGNSPKSDILPVCELGAATVWIPAQATWEHEDADETVMNASGCLRLASMRELIPALNQD